MHTDEYVKAPGATKEYVEDYATWLGADTISTSTWVVPAGITKVSDTKTNTTTTIWISGGAHNNQYDCVNTITTAAGRVEVRTIHIDVFRT